MNLSSFLQRLPAARVLRKTKDSLVAVGAKDRFNQMIRPYGRVLDFKLITRLRTVFASFRLKGEVDAIQFWVHEYRLVENKKGETFIVVDVLDSIIFSACLFTGQIFAGAMTAWFLSFGRKLLKQSRANSARMLLQAFGKQPSFARVIRGNTEVELALTEVRRDDRVLVHTGEVIPVDGKVDEGDALVDQHALTGESAPAEKSRDNVFATTVILAGKILIRVERRQGYRIRQNNGD